jgi:mannosyltransferase OCH1-like enzyme
MIVHIFSNSKEEVWQKCIDTWKNSPYKVRVWTDEDLEKFISKTKFYEKYKSLEKRIYQIDFLKYVVLYEKGGIYSDADVMYLKDFTYLIKQDMLNIVESQIKPIGELEPFFMYSPKKNKELLNIIERCDNREDAHSSCGAKILILNENIHMLNREYFNPSYRSQDFKENKTYIKHLNTFSWK